MLPLIFKKSKNILLCLLACCALIWPALYNGYPLVYSDTGSYIASGFTQEVPIDRPLIYGLFVKLSSFGFSLWFVIITQALLVFFVVKTFLENVVPHRSMLYTSILLIILSFTTSVSNFTSQIMPDIFSALGILGIASLVLHPKITRKNLILILIIVFAAMTHLSNLIVLLGLSGIALLLSLFKIIPKTTFVKITLVSLLPIFGTVIVNKIYNDQYQISRASNVFLMGRLIETGVVQDYLNEYCQHEDYVLCERKNELPNKAYKFLWRDNSPLYDKECRAVNWTYCWESKNDAFGVLLFDILKTPAYRNRVLKRCVQDFFIQIFDVNLGILDPQRENTPTYDWVKSKYPNDFTAYENSKQYASTLHFKTENRILSITLILSIFLLITAAVFKRKLDFIPNKPTLISFYFLILGILVNALIVVSFSAVLDRYQSRVIWLIPLIALMFILLYKNKHAHGNK